MCYGSFVMVELDTLPYEIHSGPDPKVLHSSVEVLVRAARYFLPRLAACKDLPEPNPGDLNFGVTDLADVERFCPGVLNHSYPASLWESSQKAGQAVAFAVADCLRWPQKFNMPDTRVRGPGLNWRLFYTALNDLDGHFAFPEGFTGESLGDSPFFGLWTPASRLVSTQVLTPAYDPSHVVTSTAFCPGHEAHPELLMLDGVQPKSFDGNVALHLPAGAVYRRWGNFRGHAPALGQSAWSFRIAMN